ncbi:MAG: hypothetical protein MSQ83_07040 [Phascolarctobacterium sp.]|nr:hypothetical protein [Phascolarctobacterium sp.]
MAQLEEIRQIIMNMKSQSKAQTKNEVPQIEGSTALVIEPQPVKIAENMQLIRGGKLDNSRSERPNTQNLRGQYGDTDPFQSQLKTDRREASSKPVEPSKNEGPSVDTCGKIKNAVKELILNLDYGPIKGIKGNILFKKGALKLLRLCGYKHSDQLLDKTVDVANGFIGYTVKVVIVDENGVPIAEAIGSANSKERKFEDKGFSADSLLVTMAAKRGLINAIKELLV